MNQQQIFEERDPVDAVADQHIIVEPFGDLSKNIKYVCSPCGEAQKSPLQPHRSKQIGPPSEHGCSLRYQSGGWGWPCPLKRNCWAPEWPWVIVWETLIGGPHRPIVWYFSSPRSHPLTASPLAAEHVHETVPGSGCLLQPWVFFLLRWDSGTDRTHRIL